MSSLYSNDQMDGFNLLTPAIEDSTYSLKVHMKAIEAYSLFKN